MGGSIVDWPRLMSQVYENLVPGGYIELYDIASESGCDDGTLRQDSCFRDFERALVEAAKIFGREGGIGAKHMGWLKDAGFEDMTENTVKIPISPWPKDPKQHEIGRWTALHTEDTFESYGLALFDRVLGWSLPKIHTLIAGCKAELRKGDMHIYTKL